MKYLIIPFLAFMLSGCQTTNPTPLDITVTKYQVVMPPDQFLKCNPVILPQEFKTNAEVAKEIAHLYNDERICSNNLKAVRDFLAKAKTDTE